VKCDIIIYNWCKEKGHKEISCHAKKYKQLQVMPEQAAAHAKLKCNNCGHTSSHATKDCKVKANDAKNTVHANAMNKEQRNMVKHEFVIGAVIEEMCDVHHCIPQSVSTRHHKCILK